MKTILYKKIASDTSFLRILHIVNVDKERKHLIYLKKGELKELKGEAFDNLVSLVNSGKSEKISRCAMLMKNTYTGNRYLVIDRVFYDNF